MKTLLKTAIGMIKRAKTKLSSHKTNGGPKDVKEAVMQDFSDIVAFMEAMHEIEDQMSNVKHELQEIKQTFAVVPRWHNREQGTTANPPYISHIKTKRDDHKIDFPRPVSVTMHHAWAQTAKNQCH
jgi:hypothetical protein